MFPETAPGSFIYEEWGTGFRSAHLPEFLALNPNATVPVIIDGEHVLWESNTICRYLAGREGCIDLLPKAGGAGAGRAMDGLAGG